MYHSIVESVSLKDLQKYVDLETFTHFKIQNAASIYTLLLTEPVYQYLRDALNTTKNNIEATRT